MHHKAVFLQIGSCIRLFHFISFNRTHNGSRKFCIIDSVCFVVKLQAFLVSLVACSPSWCISVRFTIYLLPTLCKIFDLQSYANWAEREWILFNVIDSPIFTFTHQNTSTGASKLVELSFMSALRYKYFHQAIISPPLMRNFINFRDSPSARAAVACLRKPISIRRQV